MRVYGLLLSSFLCFSLSAQTPVSSVLFPGDTTTLQVMISDTDAIQSPPLKVRGRAVTLDSFAELLGISGFIDGDSICFVVREDTICIDGVLGSASNGVDTVFHEGDSICVALTNGDTLCVLDGGGGASDTGIVILENYDGLSAYAGGANYVYVRDSLWGGYFELKASGTADTALIVAGPDRLWHRIVRDNRFWLTWFNEKFPTDTTWERRMQYAVDTISARHGAYGTGTLYVPYVDTLLVSDTYIYWLDTLGTDPYDTMDLKDVKYCVELRSNLCIVMDELASFKLIDTLIKENADSIDRVNMFIADSIQNFAWTGGIIDGNAGNQFREAPGYYGRKWYGNLFQFYDTAQVFGSQYLSFRNMKLQNHSGQGIYFVGNAARKIAAENITQAGLIDSADISHIRFIHAIHADSTLTELPGFYYKDSTLISNGRQLSDTYNPWIIWSMRPIQQGYNGANFNIGTASSPNVVGDRNNNIFQIGINAGGDGFEDATKDAFLFSFEDHYNPAGDSINELHLVQRKANSGDSYRIATWFLSKTTPDLRTYANYIQQFDLRDANSLTNDGLYFRAYRENANVTGMRLLGSSGSTGGNQDGVSHVVNITNNEYTISPYGLMPASAKVYMHGFNYVYVNKLGITNVWGTTEGSDGVATSVTGREGFYGGIVNVGQGFGINLVNGTQEVDTSQVVTQFDISGLMDNWLLAASGTGGTETVTDGETVTITGAGINVATRSGANVTVTGTEVDGSISNELQTLANTSDATSHTVTLSNSGGSVQLVEGDFINMATSGTGLNGIVTLSVDTTGFGAAYAEDNGNLAGNLDTLFHTSSSGLIDTVVVVTAGSDTYANIDSMDVDVSTNAPTLDFRGPFIAISETPTDEFNISLNQEILEDSTANFIIGGNVITESYSDANGTLTLNWDGFIVDGSDDSETFTVGGGVTTMVFQGVGIDADIQVGGTVEMELDINELTEDPAAEGDEFLAYYDVSGVTHEKIDVNNLPYIATEVDGSTTNEAWTIDAEDDANTEVIDNDQVTFGGTGGLVVTYNTTTNLLNYDATGVTGTGDGNGIYDGDGTTPADVDVTITDNINFDGVVFMDQTNLEVGINTSGPSHYLHVAQTADTKDGVFIESTTTADEMATLNLRGRQDGTDGNSSRLIFSNFDDDVGAADATATLGWIEMDRSQDDDHGGIMTLSTNKINTTETEHIVLDAVTETTKVNGLKVPQTTTATNITIGNDGGMYYQNGGAEAVTVTFPNADNVLGMVVYFYAPQVTTLTLAISGGSSDTITDLITNDQKVVTCYAIAANLWVCQN